MSETNRTIKELLARIERSMESRQHLGQGTPDFLYVDMDKMHLLKMAAGNFELGQDSYKVSVQCTNGALELYVHGIRTLAVFTTQDHVRMS